MKTCCPGPVLVIVWLVTAVWDVHPVVIAPMLEEGSLHAAEVWRSSLHCEGITALVLIVSHSLILIKHLMVAPRFFSR